MTSPLGTGKWLNFFTVYHAPPKLSFSRILLCFVANFLGYAAPSVAPHPKLSNATPFKETVPRDFRLQESGAWGKMIDEKILKQNIS
jgi:hypothetical protein